VTRWVVVAPEVLVAALAAALFLRGTLARGRVSRDDYPLGVVGGVAFLLSIATLGADEAFLYGAYRVDFFSQLAKAGALAWLVIGMVQGSGRADVRGSTSGYRSAPAVSFPLALLVLGAMLSVSATDLVALLIALEIGSLSAIALVAADAGEREVRAPLRRLVTSSLGATAATLLGAALLLAATGSTLLTAVGDGLQDPEVPNVAAVGVALVLGGLLYRLGGVPWYAPLPLMLRSTSSPVVVAAVALWIATASVLCRLSVVLGALGPPAAAALVLVGLAAVVTNGFQAARTRGDVRCALSFALAAQAGGIAAALAPRTPDAAGAGLLLALVAGTALGLASLTLAPLESEAGPVTGAQLTGRARRDPYAGTALSVLFLSAAGVPLTAGYVARADLARLGWDGWPLAAVTVWLAAIAVLGPALGVLRALWARPSGAALAHPASARAVIILFAVLAVALGVAAGPLRALAARVADAVT
jgi:NADH-quinone oxidoreductase subunit N